MYVLISPAKKLNNETSPVEGVTHPSLLTDSEVLVAEARQKTVPELQKLMGISDKLATLNAARFQSFSTPFTPQNAQPAVLMFAGDTYVGLEASTLTEEDLDYAQQHLGILSGLYGLLRPKDLIQAYRLEMGTRMKTKRGSNLYSFWGDKITEEVNAHLKSHERKTVINLASKEYFSSVQADKLLGTVITPVFKENRNGKLKIISFSAKRARGTMARYIIKNRIEQPEALKSFAEDSYRYNPQLSDEQNWVFVR